MQGGHEVAHDKVAQNRVAQTRMSVGRSGGILPPLECTRRQDAAATMTHHSTLDQAPAQLLKIAYGAPAR